MTSKARSSVTSLPPYPGSLAGSLLAAREAVMVPIRPVLRAAGFTDQQWRVLRVLADSGPLDASSIAELALLYPPSVTRILRELEEREFIDRKSDPADRRRSVIDVTPAGKAIVRETAKRTTEVLARYDAAFGEERLARLISEAAELSRALARFAPEGSPGRGDD